MMRTNARVEASRPGVGPWWRCRPGPADWLLFAALAAAVFGGIPAVAGTFTATVTGTEIKIMYTPSTNCNKVTLIQTVKATASNEDGSMSMNVPYDKWDTLDHMNDDAIANGTVVDHKFCEKDPYVNGGVDAQDTDGVAGKKTATVTQDATFTDEPHAGVPKIGKDKFTATFEVCAYCADVPPGTSLNECMTWTYMNSKTNGESVMTTGGTGAGNALAQSQDSKDAIAKFNDNHGTANAPHSKCPEKIAADARIDEHGRIQDIDPLTVPPPGYAEGTQDIPALSPGVMTGLAILFVTSALILLWRNRRRIPPGTEVTYG